jgi:hypothetical protein
VKKRQANFKELEGKILLQIIGSVGEDEMKFITKDRKVYKMYHDQDCCERVDIDDICGELNDLIGSVVVSAEETIQKNENPKDVELPEYQDDSFTWTFYNISTSKGAVTIRWYGDSNGYYSESVDFECEEAG